MCSGYAEGYVNVAVDARQMDIKQQLEQQLAGGEQLEHNPELLQEVTHLVEYPKVLRGRFDQAYLRLPAAVIHEVINQQQKCFLVYDADQKLVNGFLIVANFKSNAPDAVIEGNQKVVQARLSDATFFVDRDLQKSPDDFNQQLSEVIFHPKLGSVAEKVARVTRLAEHFAPLCKADRDQAAKAGQYLKFDLVSQTVQEWSKLEGVFAGFMLSQAGFAPEVSQAVAEHVQPKGAHDPLPSSVLGQLMALVDRLDSLVGFAALGVWPKADKDAYGMRRLALAVARLISELKLDLSFLQIVAVAVEAYGQLAQSVDIEKLVDLVRDRHQYSLVSWHGAEPWLLQFCQAEPYRPAELVVKADAMVVFAKTDAYADFLAVIKRVDNFVKHLDASGSDWQSLPGAAPQEVALGTAVQQAKQAISSHLAEGDYRSVYARIADLRERVDAFFDEVHINVEDATIKQNRLNLVFGLYALL